MTPRKVAISLVGIAAVTALALTGCSGGSGGSGGSGDADNTIDGTPSGDITYLTQRTDLKTDGTFDKYIAEFQKTYPDVNVTIDAITNYQDDVITRMSSPNGYGDALGMPNLSQDKFPQFFEALGKTADFADEYRFLTPSSFDGTQYGLALGGNASGILYNTAVWKDAGITDMPTTSDDFIADLQKIKDNTDAIPLYTNYKDGWPLGPQWTGNIGSVTGDPDASSEMARNKAPWTEGTDIYNIDSVLFDAVSKQLTEPDPITTNWEQSKGDLATGKIATLVLGSWAVSQFQAAAKDAGQPDDTVGYMAWPAEVGGKQYAMVGGDIQQVVNKNSPHKAAAFAWINFLIEKSGYTDTQGMISSLKSGPMPATLQSMSDNGVELLELNAAPAGEEALLQNIADKSQVDINGQLYRQKLIDVARGQADGDKDSYFADLNKRWADAVTSEAP